MERIDSTFIHSTYNVVMIQGEPCPTDCSVTPPSGHKLKVRCVAVIIHQGGRVKEAAQRDRGCHAHLRLGLVPGLIFYAQTTPGRCVVQTVFRFIHIVVLSWSNE